MQRCYIFGLGVLLAASSALAQSTDARFGSPTRFTATTGEGIYADLCQGCHMAGGRGATGAGAYPALAQDPRLASSDYVLAMVIRGRKDMPAFGDFLNDDQVAAVANFVRSHFGNDFPGEVTAAGVEAARR
ncbi:MAG TPA: cytochrome c [Xanthobacteraceae bacterium]|nr:cytochrome c [Xanthobacteraceae bacterium]